jgi:outer membrane lipoprotein LolB
MGGAIAPAMPFGRVRLRRLRPPRGGLRAIVPLVALASAVLLAGCAGTPVATTGAEASRPFVDTPFVAVGRLSARHGSDAVAVEFRWQHAPPRDALTVSSPLGQTVAELTGDASARLVEVRTADGRRDSASDWSELTQRVLGFPLPLNAVAAWIRGAPRDGAPSTMERAPDGRASLLRQDGWEIVYDYADAAARMPARLRISYPEFEIRVVIDQWR